MKRYIANQKALHRAGTFQEKYFVLLKLNNHESDERYIWD